MTIVPFTADQTDALQEVVNIAMGQAGASLAAVLDAYVALSVPRTRIVTVAQAAPAVAAAVERAPDLTVVRQAFFSHLRGEAFLLFGRQGCAGLAGLLGHEEGAEDELVLDVSNILVGAVLNGVAAQLATDFSYSPPSVMALQGDITDLLSAEQLGWSHALLIEVNFRLESHGFRCHLLLMMPEESIELMRGELDEMLAAI